MTLNTLTGLIIFHLPLSILSLLFFSLWFWGAGRGLTPTYCIAWALLPSGFPLDLANGGIGWRSEVRRERGWVFVCSLLASALWFWWWLHLFPLPPQSPYHHTCCLLSSSMALALTKIQEYCFLPLLLLDGGGVWVIVSCYCWSLCAQYLLVPSSLSPPL